MSYSYFFSNVSEIYSYFSSASTNDNCIRPILQRPCYRDRPKSSYWISGHFSCHYSVVSFLSFLYEILFSSYVSQVAANYVAMVPNGKVFDR